MTQCTEIQFALRVLVFAAALFSQGCVAVLCLNGRAPALIGTETVPANATTDVPNSVTITCHAAID